MLDHYIQREIVYRLAHAESLRFSHLKPDELENKLFDYHLKKVVSAGYVVKLDSGEYCLSPEGQRLGKGALASQKRLLNRAYSLLLLAIRSADGSWLLYRRPNQPLLGKVGLPQAQPEAGHEVCETAAAALKVATGVTTDFHVHAHGFMSLYRANELQSFIHFTLLTAEAEQSKTLSDDSYFWCEAPDFSGNDMLPTMPALTVLLEQPAGGFQELTIRLDD